MNKTNNNYGKFLLLWAGELISSIGGGLTSFGLGLYICKQILAAHGQTISCEDGTELGGARFVFYFPFPPEDKQE